MSTKTHQIRFTRGHCTYHVYLKYEQENSSIYYGASIYRGNINEKEYNNDRLFHTAFERFSRFPVTILIDLDTNIRTRQDLVTYFNSKTFQKFLVKRGFVTHGVRARNGHNPVKSLMHKYLTQQICTHKKNLRRAISNAQTQETHFKKNPNIRTYEMDSFQGMILNSLMKQPTHTLVFKKQKRTFHVAYKHLDSGETLYGGSIYLPTNGSLPYDCKAHLNTAVNRLNNCPIHITISNTHQYPTSSSTKGLLTNSNKIVNQFRKAFLTHGVRYKDNENSHRYITTHKIQFEFQNNKKKLMRSINLTENKLSTFKKSSSLYTPPKPTLMRRNAISKKSHKDIISAVTSGLRADLDVVQDIKEIRRCKGYCN